MYSHPDNPVRHSYPIVNHKDGLAAAVTLCLQTMPYILARLAILGGFTIVSLIWIGSTFTLATLFAEYGGGMAFLFGIAAPAGGYMWLKKYVLYILKAGHIAVITRLVTHGSLEENNNQIEYGKKIVTDNFAEVNMMFALDAIVGGVAKSFTRTVGFVTSFIPIPGISNLVDVLEKIVERATTYIDECIFSYNLARGDENKWRSSKDALVYYGQNWKPVLKTAVWSLVIEYGITFALFIVFMIPCALIKWMIPALGSFAFIFALIFALNIKAAFVHPIMLTMVMLTFHKEAKDQEINPEVDKTLSKVSDKFQDLTQKANEWISARTGSGKKEDTPAK